MTISTEIEEVFIDTLDWMDFERLCGHILEKSGYGQVMDVRATQDGGRDVILQRNDSSQFFAECKFQQGSIGRPIVQKFHSALINWKGQKGFLMVTGKFTREAVEYAKNLSPPIELLDLPKLIDLADRAGIKILSKSEQMTLNCFPASDPVQFKLKCKPFFDKFLSSPKPASDIFEIIPEKVELMALYSVHYDLDEEFATSVGKLHSIHKSNESILVQANKTGNLIKPEITEFVESTPTHEIRELPDFGCETQRDNFEMDLGTLKTTAKKMISQMNTVNVHYIGKNNQRYTRLCKPSEQNIFLKNVKQVFLPIRLVKFMAIKNEYPTRLVENQVSVCFDKEVLKCKTCNEILKSKHRPMLCNSCGGITHSPKRFRSHGFLCHECGKTVCKDCSISKRHHLILRKHLCDSCVKAS